MPLDREAPHAKPLACHLLLLAAAQTLTSRRAPQSAPARPLLMLRNRCSVHLCTSHPPLRRGSEPHVSAYYLRDSSPSTRMRGGASARTLSRNHTPAPLG